MCIRDSFPGWSRAIELHCAKCNICCMHQKRKPREPELAMDQPSEPFDTVSGDCFQWQGKEYLMLTDNLTGYSRYYSFSKTPNTRMIISKIKEWCLDFGYMSHFWSDGAGNFTSDEMKRFYSDNKILHRQGAGEHSEAVSYTHLTLPTKRIV